MRQFVGHAAFQAESVSCRCGWRGVGRLAERGRLYDIGVEVLCPACTRQLGVVLFDIAPPEAAPPLAPPSERMHLDPALANLLNFFDAMTLAEHERAQVLLASGLPLTREAWVEAFFTGQDAANLPPEIEAHLPRPLARRR